MLDGAAVSGRVEAVQEKPLRLLVAGKSYDAAGMSSASLADFYRTARGPQANLEHLIHFAVFDGAAALADEVLKKKPGALEARMKDLHRKAAEAQQALAETRKEKPPAEAIVPPPKR